MMDIRQKQKRKQKKVKHGIREEKKKYDDDNSSGNKKWERHKHKARQGKANQIYVYSLLQRSHLISYNDSAFCRLKQWQHKRLRTDAKRAKGMSQMCPCVWVRVSVCFCVVKMDEHGISEECWAHNGEFLFAWLLWRQISFRWFTPI